MSESWHDEEPRASQYLLIPCSGTVAAGTEAGHTYLVKDLNQGLTSEIGWMTYDDAVTQLPPGTLKVSDSHSICPPCIDAAGL
jgi:hypothetical protein